MSNIIYLFRNDLRLHDNPALVKAIDTGLEIIPIYVFDNKFLEDEVYGFKRCGEHRKMFLFETVAELSENISKAGSRLLIFKGDTPKIISELLQKFDVEAVYTQSEYAMEEQKTDEIITNMVKLKSNHGSLLFSPDIVSFPIEKSPFYFTAFKNKVWELGQFVNVFDTIEQICSPNTLFNFNSEHIFTLPDIEEIGLFRGGEMQGLARMFDYIKSPDCLNYSQTRNLLHGINFSSHLAPWLANGALSVRVVWNNLLQLTASNSIQEESLKTLQEQLIWRDYFRYLMMRYGSKLFWVKGLRTSPVGMHNDIETFNRWCAGESGEPLIDALMRELKATGFMSNRGRMLVSYYLAKVLKVNWQWGAAWFESQLIDYDVYCNYGNWAYQSGRGTDSRVNRRFNLVKQAEKFDADAGFRTKWKTI